MIFLVGKRNLPTDGVQDYCEYLGSALQKCGIRVELERVDGASEGWLRALRKLSNSGRNWRSHWVVLQYTAMAWSARGFPFGALISLMVAKRRGGRCAVVFHEPVGLSGPRRIDRIRGACQNWAIRRIHNLCEKSVFPEPLEKIAWLRRGDQKAVFIPIGANLPDDVRQRQAADQKSSASRTVAIYCLSDPPNLNREINDISGAVRIASANGTKLRVVFLGKGTAEADKEIPRAFKGLPVDVSNLGILSSEAVRRRLYQSDAMLCVRGPLYLRRGSALAGIACGLPVVGYAGAAEGTPLAEAGVVLVPFGDREALGFVLREILSDETLAASLRERSLQAHSRYFRWQAIAEQFDCVLENR